MARIPYEYDGGTLYMQGECGLCRSPFTVSLGAASGVTSAQQCIDINGCPRCVLRTRNLNASRRASVRGYQLVRHCGNLGCLRLFRASGIPRSGEYSDQSSIMCCRSGGIVGGGSCSAPICRLIIVVKAL